MPDAPIASTDLKFFTNEESGPSLYERFKRTLTEVSHFDILVGYFRISGFHRLYEALEDVEHIRILVGLNVGRTTYDLIQEHRGQGDFDFESHARTRQRMQSRVVAEMEQTDETREIEEGLRAFVRFLEEGKMEIRVFPTANIHAKVYIGRYDSDVHYGHVITGSTSSRAPSTSRSSGSGSRSWWTRRTSSTSSRCPTCGTRSCRGTPSSAWSGTCSITRKRTAYTG
jgi:hypothetical protein